MILSLAFLLLGAVLLGDPRLIIGVMLIVTAGFLAIRGERAFGRHRC